MNIKPFLLIPIFLLSLCGFSQEGVPVYSDYLSDNMYLLHPSMAGVSPRTQVRLTARQQWFDQRDAPNLQTLSVNSRVGKRSGLGVIAYNDKNGYHSQTGGYLTYAHHIEMSKFDGQLNMFSFGVSAGFTQSRLDERSFDLSDFDPIIGGIMQSHNYFNVDVGMSYNIYDFSAHFTVKNVLFQNRSIYTEKYESNNQRKYLFSAGYAFSDIEELWVFEPSVLFQMTERTSEKAFDTNMKVWRKMNFGSMWGVLSYRRSFDGAEYVSGEQIKDQKLQYITPVIGVSLREFLFAYTYSYQVGNVRFDNGGYHQITLGYTFGSGDANKYDCNCPNVN